MLKILPSRELGLSHVFLNKFGDPMNAKKWSEHNWKGPLKTLGVHFSSGFSFSLSPSIRCCSRSRISCSRLLGSNPIQDGKDGESFS